MFVPARLTTLADILRRTWAKGLDVLAGIADERRRAAPPQGRAGLPHIAATLGYDQTPS